MSPSMKREQAAVSQALSVVSDDHCVEPLHGGSDALIRPWRQEDWQRETAFIRRLSAESRWARFLSEFREPSQAIIDPMMAVDGDRSAASVALAHDDGMLRKIGICRYGGRSVRRAPILF